MLDFPVLHHLLEFAQLVSVVSMMHPTISSCHPLLLYLQSLAASESFPVSRLFASDGQTVGASASASIFPMNIKGSFPLGLTDLISCCPRDSPTLQFFSSSPYLWSSSVHDSDCSHEVKTLAPWEKSYDQPRQHIKKQRYYFSKNICLVKAMAFPASGSFHMSKFFT